MSNAICVCPDFVGKNISNAIIFSSFFIGEICNKPNQLVLDTDEQLKLAYLRSVQSESTSYEMYKAWQATLDASMQGKILYTTPSISSDNIKDLIYNIVTRSATTFNKMIIASNNNDYEPYIQELIKQRVELINASSLAVLRKSTMKDSNITLHGFDYDLSWVIHRLGRRHLKGLSEDQHNDYLRDMLLAKNYEVKDQSREGESQTGKQAGELDLIIEDKGMLFSIIEALILNAVDKTNILKHYKKLLTNYNPLQVKRLFLVTYYEGPRFDDWGRRYHEYIQSITPEDLELEGYAITDIKEIELSFMGMKKIEHHFEYNNEHFSCIHYAVKI